MSSANFIFFAFPGRGNGVKETTPLAGSGLRIREAPEEGYNDFVMSYEGKGNDGARFTTWDGPSKGCYCFRIRSEFDESGKLKSCLYGKVYDGFWFDYVMKKDRSIIDIARLKFTYYLNKTPLERNHLLSEQDAARQEPGVRHEAQPQLQQEIQAHGTLDSVFSPERGLAPPGLRYWQ